MNEEELDKYIKGKFEEIHSKMLNKQFVSAGTLIRFRDACFQKGKLEQKKEELKKWEKFKKDFCSYKSCDACSVNLEEIDKIIKQLQKEIGGDNQNE